MANSSVQPTRSLLGAMKPAYLITAQEAARNWRVRTDEGLTRYETSKRIVIYGKNIIPRNKPRSAWLVFLDRFKDALVLFLVGAAFLSLVLGRVGDAVIIGLAIILDAALTYVQVRRTERTLERLRNHLQQKARVKRDGQVKEIWASELVPGDIIGFRAGERIPADARLLSCSGLRIRESALTGEAEDVHKDPHTLESRSPLGNRSNMVYLGTTVMSGSGWAIVSATGTKTEFGKIAQMLKAQSSPISPLRQKLNQSGVVIAWTTVGLVTAVLGLSLLLGARWEESVRTAIALIVSAIPEDLTVVLTVSLAIGVRRILKQRGLVRELTSGESLGAATVICTDKTGTLTLGQMRPEAFYAADGTKFPAGRLNKGDDVPLFLTALAVANSHQTSGSLGSATERSITDFVQSLGLNMAETTRVWVKRDGLAFDNKWKYVASLNDHPVDSTRVLFVTGAPEVLLEQSARVQGKRGELSLTAVRRHEIQAQWQKYADKGERLIGVAIRKNVRQTSITRQDIRNLTFLGVLAISDPVRPEVIPAIAECRSAGVAVKIITGDYETTAKAVARQVGLSVQDDMVLNGSDLEGMSDSELEQRIESITVFARINPLDKQRIVKALQKRGHIVAMTGDGVNDAVALKSADIGIAMGSGKDIAKDASDLVLLDDSFATIVAAIREGRVVRDNVRKVIAFLLSTNIAEVAIFIASLAMKLPLPLVPAQILWINIVTDGTSDLALAMEPGERGVMQRKPEDPKISLLNKNLAWHMVLTGLILTLGASALYWYLNVYLGKDLRYSRTMVFMFISVSAILSTWSYRSLRTGLLRQGWSGNPWLLVSGFFSLGLQCLAIYVPAFQGWFETVPLAGTDWAMIASLAILTTALVDLRKPIISWVLPKP